MKTTKTRYQHLGDHLKNILDNIMLGVDKEIIDIESKLPDLHSSHEGVCHGIKLDDLSCKNDNSCGDMYNKVGWCAKHRRMADEVWKTFIENVTTKVIPNAVDIQLLEVRSLRAKIKHREYLDTIESVIEMFGDTLKKSFLELHKSEFKNHEIALNKLLDYKKQLAKESLSRHTTDDCKKFLRNQQFRVLKSYARDLDIPLKQQLRDNKSLLINAICLVKL